MNLLPVARRVKIRISSGGSSHADLDSLLRRFCLSDLAPLMADGRLGRWLIQIGEPAKAAVLESAGTINLNDPESVSSFLHVFFDFDSISDLATEWINRGLEVNIKSLLLPELLKDNQDLALMFAERDFSCAQPSHIELWNRVLPALEPNDAESAIKLAAYLQTLGHQGCAKKVMMKFSADEKVKKIVDRAVAENVLNELKFWLTNIRLVRVYRPNLRLDSNESSEFINSALHTISEANRNYYSKNADDHGERYRPSILVGKDALSELMLSRHKGKYMLVFRLIVSLCKMQFFDKQGSLTVGTIPGLPLLSDQRIEYSAVVDPRLRSFNSLSDFCRASFSAQISYIISETLVKRYEIYFDDEEQ